MSGTVCDLHRKFSVCSFLQVVRLMQTSENVCILVYRLFRVRANMSTIIVHLGHRKMSESWYIRLFAVQASKKTVYMYLMYSALWSYDESLFNLRHRKMSEIWSELVSWPKRICFVLFILMRVLSVVSFSLSRHSTCRSSFHRSPSRTNAKRSKSLISPKSILFVFHLLFFSCSARVLQVDG